MTRSCGDCGLCCKLLGVAPIDKPAGRWCSHYSRRGCGIYAQRPGPCSSFTCLWLDSERLDESWRPSKAKFVMYTERDDKRLNIVVDPAAPTAWTREPYYSFIKRMSERAYDGHELVVSVGDRRIVVFPHEDVDLGIVNPNHLIISGYADRGGERVPYAMVMSEPPQP